MTIRYKCDECGSVLNIKDEKAGTQGRCPKCKTEFQVPAPASGASGDPPRAPAPSEAVVAESTGARSKRPPEKKRPSEKLSDDEIEKILEAKEGPASHDEYGVADDDDEFEDDEEGDDEYEDDDDDEYEDDDDDEYEDEDEDDDESALEDDAPPRDAISGRGGKRDKDDDEADWDEGENRRSREKKSRRREPPPPQPPVSVSGIAQSLMSRDKGTKLEPSEEKKGRRLFGAGGEHESDRDDEEGFTLQEKIKYIGRYALPAIIGIGFGFLLFTWWMARWRRGEIPTLAPVSGTVTLDGVPLRMAEVHFHPMQLDPKKPNLKLSSSVGYTDANGNYTLTYVANVEGAVPGKHRVQIYASDEKGQPLVPAAYNAVTTLSADVKPEGNVNVNFELKSSAKEGGTGRGSFNPRGR